MSIRRPLVTVVALVLVAAVCAAATVVTYARLRLDGQVPYTAVFADVSGLRPRDDVRIAGITVGSVTDIVVDERNEVQVAFTVQQANPVPAGARAIVRYKNLIGQRYLELVASAGDPVPLPPGGVIPIAQTRPALDLDEVYNGFAPLFEGLAPEQVNVLSASLIAVFEGQSGAAEELLGSIGSLTGTLADKDAVIGDMITSLNTLLDTVNARGPQVAEMVDELQRLVSGLAEDRRRIGDSIERIDRLTASASGLLADARPLIADDVRETRRLAELVNADAEELDRLLQRLPGYYQVLGRVGIYQSAFQFYLCGVQLKVGDVLSDMIASQEKRCQY